MGRRSAVALILLGFLLSGCTGSTRDKWLMIFFNDPPARKTADQVTDLPDTLAVLNVPAYTMGSSHAPYEAGACHVCHDLVGSMSFPGGGGWPGREPGAERIAKSKHPETAGSARLRLPSDRLCGGCHDDLDAEILDKNNLIVHAPVAAGECTYCHDPHRSKNPFLLKQADSSVMCASCHDQENAEHRCSNSQAKISPCISCHDSHASPLKSLLRQEKP